MSRYLEYLAASLVLVQAFAGQIAAGTDDYKLRRLDRLIQEGGRLDWTPDGRWIYFDRKGPDNLWDVYRMDLESGAEECITCDRTELPHGQKGNPVVHPSGRYVIIQVEIGDHWAKDYPLSRIFTQPGAGLYNDLWILDLHTDHYCPLTAVQPDQYSGSLHPQISHDGSRLLWSDLQSKANPYGDQQLAIAELQLDTDPQLVNRINYNPGPSPFWLESHGWGLDDSWVYFACAPLPDMDPVNMDICRMDLSTPDRITRLTLTAGIETEFAVWDEHAHLSPEGDVFSWISSWPFPTISGTNHWQWLRTDLWLMNADGSNAKRITHFNIPGHSEYQWERAMVADNAWRPDGKALALYIQFPETGRHEIWLVEFDAPDSPPVQ